MLEPSHPALCLQPESGVRVSLCAADQAAGVLMRELGAMRNARGTARLSLAGPGRGRSPALMRLHAFERHE